MSDQTNARLPIEPLKCALTIATTDSGGGAGIQADLKTFAAHRVFGLTVVSGVSAQNTREVTGLECLSPELVRLQLKALYDDIKVSAIKIGLLGNAANARAVAEGLKEFFPHTPVVLDPVMVSTSGFVFLPQEAIEALKELMPLAAVLTPNIPEAEVLSGRKIRNEEELKEAARVILKLGAGHVLLKGGHDSGAESKDYLLGPNVDRWLSNQRVNTTNTHGTGCTLSSAIAANLALGLDLTRAAIEAKNYVTAGLNDSINLGHGPGPLNHFHQYYHFES